jgi:hypothetical protein
MRLLLLTCSKNNLQTWENNTLEFYLDAVGRWADDMEGDYEYTGINDMDYDKINWRIFADVLLAARHYE